MDKFNKAKNAVLNKIGRILNKKAYSLVEVLVGITIMGVVIIGFTGLFLTSSLLYTKGKSNAQSSNQLYALVESKDKDLKLVGSVSIPLKFDLRTKSGNAETLVSGLSMKLNVIDTEVVLGESGGKKITLGTAAFPVNIDVGKLTSIRPGGTADVGWFEEMELIHFRHLYVRPNGEIITGNVANFFKIGSVSKAQDEIDKANL